VIQLPPEPTSTDTISTRTDVDGVLSEPEAERLIGTICFKTGPPGAVGAELEWLVGDAVDPSSPVPFNRVREILDCLKRTDAMPRAGLLTLEPGGQVELSTAPADDVAGCVAAASDDMAVLHEAFGAEGLTLTGRGLDLHRSPSRVLDLPRYAAMEEFFDRRGPWGRVMMCSTASVQVCVDAGLDDDTASGFSFRWRLMHALGPVLVAAFANSPLRRGRPTGWKCTRQLIWSRLDPYRTRAPIGAEPYATGQAGQNPRQDMVRYAMDAEVLCLRQPDGQPWTVPTGLTFRQWLRGSGQAGSPTADDLSYHLSTLFPPVRARGHLELRMIDAQPGDGWIVPVALVAALADDPAAADAAMAAAEPVWYEGPSSWLRAARLGPSDPVLAKAATECFTAADAALARSGAPEPIRGAVAGFADRYPSRGRCPADDVLDTIGIRKGQS
jgi:ergothioneine biosynthesis glutamate--cysteine ligase EgtA